MYGGGGGAVIDRSYYRSSSFYTYLVFLASNGHFYCPLHIALGPKV
jgi:hypothetical protein